MSRFYAFLKNCNPLKLWPPLIRAYRQNAAGQQITNLQRNYLKWGSISLIFIFALAWFIFYFPYFRHQGASSLFAYTNSYVLPFFSEADHPRVSEFIWRWVAEFYTNVPLIIITVTLIVVGFCYTSTKTAGPYTPFLLPLFFLLFPSPNPEMACIAIGLWLVMGALAIYSDLSRLTARKAGSAFTLILLNLYGAGASAFLYYVAGHWALIFGIATTLLQLIGVTLSLGNKKEGLLKIRFINFLITVAVMTATGVVFWRYASYSPFRGEWYMLVSLIIFGLALIPGLVLQAYNNGKIYLYQWRTRHGEQPDGKPALASSHNVMLTFSAIVVGFVLFLCSQDREIHTQMKVENALEARNYNKSLNLCATYLGVDENGESTAQKHHRHDAKIETNIKADYKLSLLMEGKLNQAENPLAETLFPEPEPELDKDAYSYLAVCRALKMPRETLALTLSGIEKDGLQNRYLGPLLGASLDMQEYNLFRNALHITKRTFGNTHHYYYYRGLSRNLLLSYEHDSTLSLQPETPENLQLAGFLDDWVRANFEEQVFGGRLFIDGDKIYIDHIAGGKQVRRRLTPRQDLQKPDNIALLEYYTFLTLHDENGEALLPYLRKLYSLVGFEVLPARL